MNTFRSDFILHSPREVFGFEARRPSSYFRQTGDRLHPSRDLERPAGRPADARGAREP